MAERFGGRYSPGAKGSPKAAPLPFDGKRRSRVGLRVNLLFFLPLPLVVRAFMLGGGGLVVTLAAFGLMILAAWLTREGARAQEAYEARKVARRPAFPRKIFGSVLTGCGLGLACLPDTTGPLLPLALGLLGALLHFMAFGPDPLTNKGIGGIDGYEQDRAARAVDAAEAYLTAMRDAIRRAGDRGLEARVDAFQAEARRMFRTVEDDPRDLTAAKRYMTVYLMGARDATVKFADLWTQGRDPQARADYQALLDDLQKGFAAQTQALLGDDRDALDVEIAVLRERLGREGIRTG
jgi:hypothetical protein